MILTLPVADDFQMWPHLAEELVSRLPLRNLVWNNPFPTRTSQMQQQIVIPALDIEFKRFSVDLFTKPALYSNPYFLHLYFVNCEVIHLIQSDHAD